MKYIFIIFLFFFISIKSVFAKEFSEVLELELLKGWRQSNGIHYGGLKVKLSPGWKTYWRHPGETGFSPEFDWTGSLNLSAVKVLWPHPKIFNDNGMLSFGYEDYVILPIEFTPYNAAKLIKARLNLRLGICEKLCVPVSRSLTTKLRASKTVLDSEIVEYMNRLPKVVSGLELKNMKCEFKVDGQILMFRSDIEFYNRDIGFKAAIVELPESNIWFALPNIERASNSIRIISKAEQSEDGAFVLNRDGIILTLISNNESVYIQGC